jgi:hypothetical protein
METFVADFIKTYGLPGAAMLGMAWMIREQRRELTEARKSLETVTDRYASAMVENAKTNIAVAEAFKRGHNT